MKKKVCVRVGVVAAPGLEEEEDRIGELPDEILVIILSCLTMKEAVTTSILSRRWKDLWKYFTGEFDFRAPVVIVRGIKLDNAHTPSYFQGASSYVRWVNNVLRSHRGHTTPDAFRVAFELDVDCNRVVNSWLRFAMETRVGILELDLGCIPSNNCSFPLHLPVSGFRNLSTLCLSRIDVTDQVVADFVSNCPLLEELRVRCSESLVDVRVAGPPNTPLKLKHLEICDCPSVKSVGILAVNLIMFKYIGPEMVMPFMTVSLLSHLEIGGFYCKCLVADLGRLLLVQPSQLERLVLDLCCLSKAKPSDALVLFARGFLEFPNLKYLELRWRLEAPDNYSTLFLSSMVEACPCLEKFKLEVTCYGMCRSSDVIGYDEAYRLYNLPLDETDVWIPRRRPSKRDIAFARSLSGCTVDPNFPLGGGAGGVRQECFYKCLKVVELGGFSGHPGLVELAMYLLENAVHLERITIDTSSQIVLPPRMDLAKQEVARQRAE